MMMTPRQIMGWHYFLERYHSKRRADRLWTQATATHGNARSINAEIRKAGKAAE